MYKYKNGTSSTADYEAAIYGLGADDEWSYLIVSDSLYSKLSSSFYKVYSNMAESVEMYHKELKDVADNAALSGDFHDSLIEYISVFEGLSEKIIQIGDSYKTLCTQFIADVEYADEDMYEAGCDPRDYSNDRMEYFISLIEDAKGHFGSWLDNFINNIWEGMKSWYFNLTQKNKYNITIPDAKYTKEYRQAILDEMNYEKQDIKDIQELVKSIDSDYEKKFGELYDALRQIKVIIDKANSIVEKGIIGEDIASLRNDVQKIIVNTYIELEETVTVDNVDQYCASEENRDVFSEYSKELDTARGDLGVEEAIYAGFATGVAQAKLEVMGFTYPEEIAPSDRYSYMLLKKELSETVSKMAGNPADISEYEKEEIYNWIYKALNGDESQIPEQYKDFFDCILKQLKDNSKTADYLFEIVEEAILPTLYDYAANLKVIQSLANTADANSMLSIAVEDLINEYTNKRVAGFNDCVETFMDKISDSAVNGIQDVIKDTFKSAYTNGNIYLWCAEKAYELSGIDEIGNASMKLYSLYEANEELINTYKANFDVVASGNYTEADVENLKNSFDIVKSTYKEEFKLAAEIAAEEGNHDLKRHYKELYKKIDKMTMSDFL